MPVRGPAPRPRVMMVHMLDRPPASQQAEQAPMLAPAARRHADPRPVRVRKQADRIPVERVVGLRHAQVREGQERDQDDGRGQNRDEARARRVPDLTEHARQPRRTLPRMPRVHGRVRRVFGRILRQAGPEPAGQERPVRARQAARAGQRARRVRGDAEQTVRLPGAADRAPHAHSSPISQDRSRHTGMRRNEPTPIRAAHGDHRSVSDANRSRSLSSDSRLIATPPCPRRTRAPCD
ncbi:hypothetical protein BLLJ_1018 [Bifidobacterium longum subsp. longum JCM 1217]|nr:hypothetical protein I118_1165 [Bifidobacterium longum D2957]BAJ66685.1 hypothetical protein BLLJ_1018 [Bifidobacterium longum subsp. longum JCM 1217]